GGGGRSLGLAPLGLAWLVLRWQWLSGLGFPGLSLARRRFPRLCLPGLGSLPFGDLGLGHGRPCGGGPFIPRAPALAEAVAKPVAARTVARPARAEAGRGVQPRRQVRHGRLTRRRRGRLRRRGGR